MIPFAVSQHLLNEREKGKVAERQRERVSVGASVGRHRNSVGQHPQQHAERERERAHRNTYGKHNEEKQCGGLFD